MLIEFDVLQSRQGGTDDVQLDTQRELNDHVLLASDNSFGKLSCNHIRRPSTLPITLHV